MAEAKNKYLDEQKENKKEQPLGITLNSARADMTIAILEVQRVYGLPAYLTDLVVSACLADIRDCANKDMLNNMRQNASDAYGNTDAPWSLF